MKGYTEYRIRRFFKEHGELFIAMFVTAVMLMWIHLGSIGLGGVW